MKWTLLCLFLLIGTLQARAEKRDGHFELAPLQAGLIEKLVEIVSGKQPAPATSDAEGETEFKLTWSGSKAEVSSQLWAYLNFAHESGLKADNQKPNFLARIGINFEKRRARVLHSHFLYKSYRQGILLLEKIGKVEPGFITGRSQSGVVAFLVTGLSQEENGMLLCPRDYGPVKTRIAPGNGIRLMDVGYRLVGVDYPLQAKSDTKLLSGHGYGRVEVEILTSPNIPRSAEYYDTTRGRDPYAAITYRRDPDEVRLTNYDRSPELPSSSGAARVIARLTNAAGFTKAVEGFNGIWIQKTHLPELVPVTIRDLPYNVLPGVCYGVIFRNTISESEHTEQPEPTPLLGEDRF